MSTLVLRGPASATIADDERVTFGLLTWHRSRHHLHGRGVGARRSRRGGCAGQPRRNHSIDGVPARGRQRADRRCGRTARASRTGATRTRIQATPWRLCAHHAGSLAVLRRTVDGRNAAPDRGRCDRPAGCGPRPDCRVASGQLGAVQDRPVASVGGSRRASRRHVRDRTNRRGRAVRLDRAG